MPQSNVRQKLHGPDPIIIFSDGFSNKTVFERKEFTRFEVVLRPLTAFDGIRIEIDSETDQVVCQSTSSIDIPYISTVRLIDL